MTSRREIPSDERAGDAQLGRHPFFLHCVMHAADLRRQKEGKHRQRELDPRANLSHSSTTTAQSHPLSAHGALVGTPDLLSLASITSIISYRQELPHRHRRRRLCPLFPLPVMLAAFSPFRKNSASVFLSFLLEIPPALPFPSVSRLLATDQVPPSPFLPLPRSHTSRGYANSSLSFLN